MTYALAVPAVLLSIVSLGLLYGYASARIDRLPNVIEPEELADE